MSAPALLSAQMDAAAFARLLLRLGLPAALPLLLLLFVPPAACARATACLPILRRFCDDEEKRRSH